jgi:hypothetical protein
MAEAPAKQHPSFSRQGKGTTVILQLAEDNDSIEDVENGARLSDRGSLLCGRRRAWQVDAIGGLSCKQT